LASTMSVNMRSPTIMSSESLEGWKSGVLFVSISFETLFVSESDEEEARRVDVLGALNEAKYARMPLIHANEGLSDACLRTGTPRWYDTDSAYGSRGRHQSLCYSGVYMARMEVGNVAHTRIPPASCCFVPAEILTRMTFPSPNTSRHSRHESCHIIF